MGYALKEESALRQVGCAKAESQETSDDDDKY